MEPLGKKYTSIKVKRDESKVEKKPSKSPISEKLRSSTPERAERTVYLMERKAKQLQEKEIKTDITLSMLKAYANNTSDDDINIEMFHFLRQATGLQLDGIEEEGLREITQFLLQINDIELIKSILEKIKPVDVQKVFKTLLKHQNFWKPENLDREVLNAILSSENPVEIIEAFVNNSNLNDLNSDDLNMILAFQNPVEILTALSKWKDLKNIQPMFLKGILISPEPLQLIEFAIKHPELSTLDLDIASFHQLLVIENLPEMLEIIGHALKQGMDIDIIKLTFNTKDPHKILTALINATGLWKGQSPEKLEALNQLLESENLEYQFALLDPEKFGNELFTVLSQKPESDDPAFVLHKSKSGQTFPIAEIFYQDLNRQNIALGDNPYWNDPNNPDDPLLDSADLDSPKTPEWKKKIVEQLRTDCGYIENGDAETNKKAMRTLESRLSKMLHEWKERRIQELLEFCGYVEDGDPEQNEKAKQKAYMISCNCNQNIGFRMNNASFESTDTPLTLNNQNKFMLVQGSYDQTLKISKNKMGDILLTTTMEANNLPNLSEFLPKNKMQTRETSEDIPAMVNMQFGIIVTNNAEWQQYDDSFVSFMFVLKPTIE